MQHKVTITFRDGRQEELANFSRVHTSGEFLCVTYDHESRPMTHWYNAADIAHVRQEFVVAPAA